MSEYNQSGIDVLILLLLGFEDLMLVCAISYYRKVRSESTTRDWRDGLLTKIMYLVLERTCVQFPAFTLGGS